MCTKLDSIIKNELPKEALEVDKKLSWLQNFVLDTAATLLTAYDDLTSDKDKALDADRLQQAIQLKLRILGMLQHKFPSIARQRPFAP